MSILPVWSIHIHDWYNTHQYCTSVIITHTTLVEYSSVFYQCDIYTYNTGRILMSISRVSKLYFPATCYYTEQYYTFFLCVSLLLRLGAFRVPHGMHCVSLVIISELRRICSINSVIFFIPIFKIQSWKYLTTKLTWWFTIYLISRVDHITTIHKFISSKY